MMGVNTGIRGEDASRRSRVGADSSLQPPIYRPAHLSPDSFVKSHYAWGVVTLSSMMQANDAQIRSLTRPVLSHRCLMKQCICHWETTVHTRQYPYVEGRGR